MMRAKYVNKSKESGGFLVITDRLLRTRIVRTFITGKPSRVKSFNDDVMDELPGLVSYACAYL